jgi:ABC-type uncharacterized transport system auxiliary subunit
MSTREAMLRSKKTTGALKGVLAAALLAGGLAACGSAPPAPEEHYYRLQATYAARTPMANPLPGTLEVERFVADGLTSERGLVYSDAATPNQVKPYYYHFWIKPPTVMLRDELVAFLREAKAAKAVVTPEVRAHADYVLTGKIEHLEQMTGARERAILEIELAVRGAGDGKLIFLKTYRQENASAGGVGATVDALNTALSIAYADFVADLAKR